MRAQLKLAARTQQPERMGRIGVLMTFAEDHPVGQARVAAFLHGLQATGRCLAAASSSRQAANLKAIAESGHEGWSKGPSQSSFRNCQIRILPQ